MFSGLAICNQFPGRYLPVVADSLIELSAASHAVTNGLFNYADNLICEMGSRDNNTVGTAAIFLELTPGIAHEMRKAGIGPAEMADRHIAAAKFFHPALIGELALSIDPRERDILSATTTIAPLRERLANRLTRKSRSTDRRLHFMGRMVAHFVLTGEQTKHFLSD